MSLLVESWELFFFKAYFQLVYIFLYNKLETNIVCFNPTYYASLEYSLKRTDLWLIHLC